MNISHFFIDRPIFASVISIVIVILGVVSVLGLPIASYPDVAPPTVSVQANYPGASASSVAEDVAAPIEEQVNGVENMIYMLSKSSNDGQMTLDVTFKPGVDLDMAQVMVQNRVSIANAKLPPDVKKQGVTTKKKSPSILMVVNIISKTITDPVTKKEKFKYNQIDLSNFATINVKDVLSRIKGVGDVIFLGPRDYSMRIWLDPKKVAAIGLTPDIITQRLQSFNVIVSAGREGQPKIVGGQQTDMPIIVKSKINTVKEFGDVIVKEGEPGEIVYLKNLVKDDEGIELGARNYDVSSYLDGKPSIAIGVFQLPGANALDTAHSVRAAMKKLQAEVFPKGIEHDIVYDTTLFIQESINEVFSTFFQVIALVFLVILVFLQDWRLTLIPMVAVIVSLVGTFAVMSALGFSLNNLSLFGLILAIGIVTDDAIVVVESTVQYMGRGMAVRDAARSSMTEISGALIATTLVLCAVFVPTSMLAGISGQFYKQFALTIAASTVISTINALTISPALCVILLKAPTGEFGDEKPKTEALPRFGVVILGGLAAAMLAFDWIRPMFQSMDGVMIDWGVRVGLFTAGAVAGWFAAAIINTGLGWFFRGFNWAFNRAQSGYKWSVGGLLRGCVIALFVYGGLLFLTYVVFQSVPGGFIPNQDKGYLIVNAQLPNGSSLEQTEKVLAEVDDILLKTKGVGHTIRVPGYSILTGTNLPSVGGTFVILDSFEERKGIREQYSEAIAMKLRKTLNGRILSGNFAVFGAPPVEGLGSTGGFKMQVQNRGASNPRKLEGAVATLAKAGSEQPGLVGLFSSFSAKQPQKIIEVEKELATARGVQVSAINDALGFYWGSRYINDFTYKGRNWQVIAQADPAFRTSTDSLKHIKVPNPQGDMVSLESFVEIKPTVGPSIVNRYNMFYSADLSGGNLPGISSGDAIAIMSELADKLLGEGMSYEWTELSYQEIEAGKDPLSPFIFPLSVLFVFLTLAAQYESWSLPLAIILIVPMALLCALTGVLILNLDNNIFTQIGLVVLIGLAAKNAILVVEFAKQKQDEGMNRFDASLTAAELRLRPILMTALCSVLGALPLVTAAGAGAEMRIALGIAMFSGMLGVTLFGIFLTPVFYLVIRWMTEPKVSSQEEAFTP